jgi:hypothetical protein
MNFRRYKLIGLLIAFFAVYLHGEKAYSSPSASKSQHKSAFNIKSSRNNYWYAVNGGESSQILVPQPYRSLHFIKCIVTVPKGFVVCLKFLNFFSGRGDNDQPDSQKLLLFPFHVFW